MLYTTTRNNTETYTDHRVLLEDRAPGGGLFIPIHFPVLGQKEIAAMKNQSFGEIISYVLNLFFPDRLTSWDVDCCIGKHPAKIISVSHNVFLAKLWDNPQSEYSYLCSKLYDKLCSSEGKSVTEWCNIAIRVSVLFGLYGLLQKNRIRAFDICVNKYDSFDLIAAVYAKSMGLPVDKVIYTCDESDSIWDFFHKGELNAAALSDTVLERYIYNTLGYQQVQCFTESIVHNKAYRIASDQIALLNNNIFISVVGKDRLESLLAAFLSTNHLIVDPRTAMSLGGLQDYRSQAGERNPVIMLWEHAPSLFSADIQRITGLNKQEIEQHINNY